MTKQEEDFLKKNFPEGSFTQVTILVKNGDLNRMIDALKHANLTLAIMPQVQALADFENTDDDDPSKTGVPV